MRERDQTDKGLKPLVSSKGEILLLAGILLLAAILRLGAPGITEFKLDEANLSRLSLDLARGRDFPLLGIGSSVGLPNAPVNVYILAIPYLFRSDPIAATLFIGVLSVIAVGLLYALARRYYGQTAALIAALLYAASPWAVIFSRKIWAQNLLHSLVILIIGTGLLGFVEGKRWAQWLHLPLLALALQIHYGAFVLIPVSLYLLIVGRKQWTASFRYSLILLVLVSLPYLIGIAQADLLSPQKWRDALHQNEDKRTSDAVLIDDGFQLANIAITGTDIHSLAGAEQYKNYLAGVPDAYPLFSLLAMGAWAAALLMILRRNWQHQNIVLLIWFLCPVLVFTINWVPVTVHYFIPLLPAAFLLVGWLVAWLWEKYPQRLVVIISSGLIGAIVVLQVWLYLGLLDFLNTHYTPGGFGIPYHHLAEVRSAILEQQPSQVIVNTGSQFTQYDNDASVWDVLLDDVPEVRFIDEITQVYPAKSHVLYLSRNCKGEQVFQMRSAAERCWAIQAAPQLHETFFTTLDLNQHFANGVYVRGYRWQDACFDLLWEISQPTDQDYTFAIHFTDAAGKRIAIADAISWQGRYWRAEDRVVRTFCIDPVTHAQVAGLNIGMYTYDGITYHNVDVLDQQGAWVSQSIHIDF